MLLASLIVTLASCVLSIPLSRVLGRNAGWVLAVPLVISLGLILAAWSGSAGASPTVGASTGPGTLREWYPWMPTLGVGLGLRLDGLALVFCMLVLGIGAAILCYCTRYLHQGRHGSFYLLMTGFALSMQLLVLTDDLVVLFVAWEATTLCSFFLIGRSGDHAREPAIRTLLVTVAGGLALLAAVCIMVITTGTTSISAVLAHPAWSDQPSFVTVVAVLLAVAAFTKSAQFPFQSWLPDSMVAISPVSAYLHAAAMVKAGIYLLLLFSPVLAGHLVWSSLLVTAGLVTALFGAFAALRRFDLKELLAYSTMSQLGLLVMAIGVGTEASLTAAVVHTAAHALFKCALFMLVGIVDHQAGTRDLRDLQDRTVRLPATGTALVLAAASMAGLPPLLGFVSKESLLAAFVEAPGPSWVPWVVALGAVTTSALTFAYSGRLVLGGLGIWGARPGRVAEDDEGGRKPVTESTPAFWGAPAVAVLAGLGLGLAPFALDGWVSAAATAASGAAVEAHLLLWHGVNLPLVLSVTVILAGTALVVARRPVETVMAPLGLPVSGLAIVDRLRNSTIALGARFGSASGGLAPRAHLMVPAVCLAAIALAGIFTVPSLPQVVGDPTRPHDWLLVALVAVGVLAGIRARTRISALVVIGVVGFAVTLWFFNLGAIDVALTQLLVEILTVCVMVLLLRRLPATFRKDRPRRNAPVFVVAAAAGLAAAVGVYALTGRRDMSAVATYLLEETYETTGGSNIVNSILVDFRALDTLGELTVLGLAGLGMAALLMSRRPDAAPRISVDPDSPLAGSWQNLVFIRTFTRVAGPLIIILSMVLLFRGHYEPGGGFIGALVGGAGFALLYLSAPTDETPHIRWPYLTLIGLGVVVGTGTGLVGFFEGSFLAPLHAEILGLNLSTALIFDVGVYLAVIGVVLAAFNLLGRPPRARHRTTLPGEPEDSITESGRMEATSSEAAQTSTTTGGT